MTPKEYVAYVYLRLTAGRPEKAAGIDRKAIESQYGVALKWLARIVASREDDTRLQKTFTIPLVSGQAELAGFDDLLAESLPDAYITHPEVEEPLQYQPERRLLDLPPSEEFSYFWPGDGAIVCRDGKRQPLQNNDLTIIAVRIPTLDDLPAILIPDLINIGVQVARGELK